MNPNILKNTKRYLGISYTPQSYLTRELPVQYRGIPLLSSTNISAAKLKALEKLCPTKAINNSPFSLDMGRCIFCGECSFMAPNNIQFTNDYSLWAYNREDLIVYADTKWKPTANTEPLLRFKNSMKLITISTSGDSANDKEVVATENNDFNIAQFGIEFTNLARHADALVITGCISKNISKELELTFSAIPEPKIIIAVGTDAISGGLFEKSTAIDRSFFNNNKPNLYIAGSPIYPLSFIGGILGLIGRDLK